jgi:hypothetical protein
MSNKRCFPSLITIDRVGINEHYYVPDNGSAKYDPLFTNGGQQTLKPHTHVLLFGYQRGETTFVGHIIGCREDTFYFYEPLWWDIHMLLMYQYTCITFFYMFVIFPFPL